jgi:hypothetical protein
MKIFKYPLEIADTQTVSMPKGAKLLSVAFIGTQLYLWALVDLQRPMVKRTIEIYGTGHPCQSGAKSFVGTVIDQQRGLVWHVFDGVIEVEEGDNDRA